MKVIVFVSGAVKHGLESPTAGEGRWGQNLARMLGERGHQVTVVAGAPWDRPSWGNSAVVPNVTLTNVPPRGAEFDLALYIPWEHQYNGGPWESCYSIPIKAKWSVHCSFSWTHSLAQKKCPEINHALAYPYIQEDNQFKQAMLEGNPFKTFPLPMPMYKELPPVNVQDRKDIIWTCKDVFHKDWTEGHHVPRIGMAVINSIKKLRQKYSFDTYFLSTHYFKEGRWAQAFDVWNQAASIPGAHLVDLLPRDVLMAQMRKSRITAIVSGLLGSFGESIVSGCVPLCYEGHIYREGARKNGTLLDSTQATEEQIYDCMERLYADDAFYEKVISDYRQELSYYSYDSCYEYFKVMAQELGLPL